MKDFAIPIDCVRHRHLRINKDYQGILEDIGLDSFDALWNHSGGHPVKQIRPRSVFRIDLTFPSGRKTVYLKRHQLEFLGPWRLFARFLRTKGHSQGMLEFENIRAFRRSGLRTVVPIAAGERCFGLFRAESFLLTEDFHPYVSLETLLKTDPDFFKGPQGGRRKQILIAEVAALARKMHQAGFNHQDFNATHVLLHYRDEKDVPDLALFDLQRVEKNRVFRLRWKIKSLARLNYTLPEPLFTQADRKNLLLSYKKKNRFNLTDRLEWFWILKKTARIRRHTEKKRRQHPLA